MKAAVFSKPGNPLTIEILPDPTPGPSDIVMKVHSCGICGTDLHMTEDHGPAFTFPKGTIPGHEYAGEVVEVGKAVRHFKPGDRICAQPFAGCGHCLSCLMGEPSHCPEFRGLGSGFSVFALVSEQTTVRLDDRLTFDDGALVEPLAVGLHGAVLGNIKQGDKVLVIGSGPIGLGAAYFARMLGAGKVAVSATSRRKESFARAMGVDEFIVPGEDQTLAELAAQTLGGPPDIVLECAGQPGCIDTAINTVKQKGTVVIMGFCTAPDSFLPAVTMFKEVVLKGSYTYTIGEYAQVADILSRGHLEARQLITRNISLDAAPATLESLRRPNDQCKVIINPWL
jgi:2-desacetyl-2-hydroxyethyl bacteriochlorophyllide A dehydrogenase